MVGGRGWYGYFLRRHNAFIAFFPCVYQSIADSSSFQNKMRFSCREEYIQWPTFNDVMKGYLPNTLRQKQGTRYWSTERRLNVKASLILFAYMHGAVLFFTCTAIVGRRFSVCSFQLPLSYSKTQSSELNGIQSSLVKNYTWNTFRSMTGSKQWGWMSAQESYLWLFMRFLL